MFLFAVLLVSCIGFVSGASAEVLTRVRASGMGLISGGDRAAAFDQAKRAALREAVEIGVGTLVSAETRVENFALIEDHVLTRTDGYIRSFEVVEQGLIDDQTYQVEIDAVVELGNLQHRLDALELLIAHAGNPYILCLGRDRYEFGEGRVRDFSATILRGQLQRASGRFNLAAPLQTEHGMLERAAQLGFEQGADIVIRAEALVREAADIQVPFAGSSLRSLGLSSATADLRIEALWTDTGEVFAALSHSERGADVNMSTAGEKAVRTGMEKLSAELVRQLVENWREKMYSGRLVRVVVDGDSERVGHFESAFSGQVAGIEKIYRRSFSEGTAVFDVRSKDTGFAIARALTAKGIEGVKIDIIRVSPNSLRLALIN